MAINLTEWKVLKPTSKTPPKHTSYVPNILLKQINVLKENKAPIKKFHIDKLLYIAGLGNEIITNNTHVVNYETGEFNVYSKIIKKTINNYSEYFKYLIKNNIIKKVGNYCTEQEISNRYVYTNEAIKSGMQKITIEYLPLNKRLYINHQEYLKERIKKLKIYNNKEDTLQTKDLKYLKFDNILKKELFYRIQAKYDLYYRIMKYAYEHINELNFSDLKDGKKSNMTNEERLANKKNAWAIIVDKLINHSFETTIDEKGLRCFSFSTAIPAALRYCLRYKDQPLGQIDVKNSQFTHFIRVLTVEYWNEDNKRLIGTGFLKNDNTDLLYPKKYNYKKVTCSDIKEAIKKIDPIELSMFKKIVLEGKFYENMQDLLNIKTRDKAKKAMFNILFGKIYYSKGKNLTAFEKFEVKFPTISKVIRLIKTNNYELFSNVLQRAESYIMNKVYMRLYMDFKDDEDFCLKTIHDSFETPVKFLDIVNDKAEQYLEEELGYAVTLKKEIYTNPKEVQEVKEVKEVQEVQEVKEVKEVQEVVSLEKEIYSKPKKVKEETMKKKTRKQKQIQTAVLKLVERMYVGDFTAVDDNWEYQEHVDFNEIMDAFDDDDEILHEYLRLFFDDIDSD